MKQKTISYSEYDTGDVLQYRTYGNLLAKALIVEVRDMGKGNIRYKAVRILDGDMRTVFLSNENVETGEYLGNCDISIFVDKSEEVYEQAKAEPLGRSCGKAITNTIDTAIATVNRLYQNGEIPIESWQKTHDVLSELYAKNTE